jgi:vacuolar-type H+-ATPase subunit E/Vma4
MDWNDILATLCSIVVVPAVPVAVAALVRFCRAKTTEALTGIESEQVRRALEEATTAVCTAVTYTSQVYVDSLKQQGKFDKAAQQEALQTALAKAKAMLASDTKQLLEDLYGSLEDWLTTKIEQAVRDNKGTA